MGDGGCRRVCRTAWIEKFENKGGNVFAVVFAAPGTVSTSFEGTEGVGDVVFLTGGFDVQRKSVVGTDVGVVCTVDDEDGRIAGVEFLKDGLGAAPQVDDGIGTSVGLWVVVGGAG